VPPLLLDNGEPLAENTAILLFLGKRFGLWPEDALGEAKALSLVGFFASSVHVAFAHVSRPERYASDSTAFPTLRDTGLKAFHGFLKRIDGMLAEPPGSPVQKSAPMHPSKWRTKSHYLTESLPLARRARPNLPPPKMSWWAAPLA
jgi:hypothetical protein